MSEMELGFSVIVYIGSQNGVDGKAGLVLK
jgi:hypothetical protein